MNWRQYSIVTGALLVLAFGAMRVADAGELADLLAAASDAPLPAPRYVENINTGNRGSTYLHIARSESHPDTIYVSTDDGFVFASHNGGMTWREGRLAVRPSRQYGSIRQKPSMTGAPFSTDPIFRGSRKMGFLKDKLGSLFKFPYGTTGEPYLEFHPDSPAFWDTIKIGSLNEAGDVQWNDARGGAGGGLQSRFGVGIRNAAPRLGALLKSRRQVLPFNNFQIFLATRGSSPASVNMVDIDPNNPDIALAATARGLFKTTDGGTSWFLVYAGQNTQEAWAWFVKYDPALEGKVWLGTRQGVRISYDGGNNFESLTGTQLSSSSTYWLHFHSADPNIIYAGSNTGAFRTRDGGRNWEWIFFETLDAANIVTGITSQPDDPEKIMISTWDGVFRSRDGGKNWERSGGFLFTSQQLRWMVGHPTTPGHIVTITSRNLYETRDWGETWSIVYLNNSEWSMRSLLFDPTYPDRLWVTTSWELLRLSSTPPAQPDSSGVQRMNAVLLTEPGLSETMEATFRALGVHIGDQGELRERSRLAALLPQLHVFGGYFEVDNIAYLNATYLENTSSAQNVNDSPWVTDTIGRVTPDQANAAIIRPFGRGMPYGGALLSWDLKRMVFQGDEPSFGRIFGQANRGYNNAKYEVQRLFEERRRLMVHYFALRPADLGSQISLRLRLEELTTHLNALTGGLFDSAVKWIQAEPYPWDSIP